MSLASNLPQGNALEDQDPPDQRICRLLLDNRIAKTLAAVALAVQLVLPPLILEGTLNKSKRLGAFLITYFIDSAAKRSDEFIEAIQRGVQAGVLRSSDRRGIVIEEMVEEIENIGDHIPPFPE